MEFSEVVRRRRMVRRFDPDRPIDHNTVRKVLAAALRAPSAGHTQGWDFVVLDTPEARQHFWAATADREPDAWLLGVSAAPTLIVCCSNPEAYLEDEHVTYGDAIRAFRKKLILDRLQRCGGSASDAAGSLGISEPTFYRYLADAKRFP